MLRVCNTRLKRVRQGQIVKTSHKGKMKRKEKKKEKIHFCMFMRLRKKGREGSREGERVLNCSGQF